MAILNRYCDKVEKASVDEAFLDLTEIAQIELAQHSEDLEWSAVNNTIIGTPVESNRITNQHDKALFMGSYIMQRIRQTIFTELGYTCSAGIANNKTLSKIISAMHKPNKQSILRAESITAFLSTLPFKKIRNLGGKLGKSISATLPAVETCNDLL